MFSHLLKLMWNKRRANGMIFLEILLAFIVLFGVGTFLSYNVDRYSSPLGFSYENSIGVRVDIPDEMNDDSLSVLALQDRIRLDLLDLPAVEAVTWLGPINPFSGNNWNTNSKDKGFMINTQMMFVDRHFAETAEVKMREGRWFTAEDERAKYPPIVVNRAFKDKYYPDAETLVDSLMPFGNDDAQGNSQNSRVVGVTEDFKYASNFSENVPLTFFPQEGELADKNPYEMLILRLRPGSLATSEEAIYNLLVSETKSTEVVIWDMAKDQRKANRPIIIPMVILLVISGFLLVNIALGLFGVLFTQINRRRAEIGLRRAMGATPGQVTRQFILEVLLVTGAALLVGTLFAVQVPLLELIPIPGKYFYTAVVGAAAVILAVVALCALIPSRQAARLQPANVLHEG